MYLQKHQNMLKELQPDLEIVERFVGGMSNFTYKVKNKKNEFFVFRVIADGGENYVNYEVEHKNLTAIEKLDINSKVLYHDPKTGIKLSEFIPGNIINGNEDYLKIVEVLKKVHSSDIVLNNYEHMKRLRKYENLHGEKNSQYDDLKEKFTKIFINELAKFIKYPCHNDAQISNFIIDEKDNYHLLDWEFAGMNDYIYDIASFGNNNFESAVKLLEYYVENPSSEEYFRLYAWRMFQCLQWYNVALKKHQDGLSEMLKIDFLAVSKNYLDLADKMYQSVLTYTK